jgi:hypothetical protein
MALLRCTIAVFKFLNFLKQKRKIAERGCLTLLAPTHTLLTGDVYFEGFQIKYRSHDFSIKTKKQK